MKTQWGRTAVTAIVSLSLIGAVAVANEDTHQSHQPNQSIQPTDQPGEYQAKLANADELIGAKVVNREGTRLGTIEDIVLTPQRDGISYVALSYGGVLGMGGKLHAVPWSAFEVRPQGDQEYTVILNVDEAYLKTAQGFDRNNWPTVADRNWPGVSARNIPGELPRGEMGEGELGEGMRTDEPRSGTPMTQANERTQPTPGSVYGSAYGEAAQPTAGIEHRRLTELIGTTIRNAQDVELGKLDSVMIDLNQGKIAYGIVAVSRGFLGMDKKVAAVPWSSINFDPSRGTARLNADKDTLQAIAFDDDEFPNLADPQYSRDIHQRFNATPYWEAFGYVPGEQPERSATQDHPMTPDGPTS